MKKRFLTAGVIALALALSACSTTDVSSSGNESTSAESTVSVSEEAASQNDSADETPSKESGEESEEETPNNIFKVGETLDTGKAKVTFKSVEDYESDNEFIVPEDGNKYIRAYFVVENTGDSDIYVSSYDFNCFADDSATDIPLVSEKILSGGEVSPGRKTEGYVYFEVPESAKKIEIEYETSLWTQEKAIFIVKE